MSGQPHEVLLAAADLLEQRANAAAQGPWTNHQNGWCVLSTPDRENRKTWRNVAGELATSADADWIALMSPSVAAPLVAWLRKESRSAAHHIPIWSDPNSDRNFLEAPFETRTAAELDRLIGHHYGPALDFARMVLASTT